VTLEDEGAGMRFHSILICAAAAPLLAAASKPVRLQPSTPWVIDYAENSCRLIREFGADESKTLLLFESEGPDDMDMLLIGKPLRTYGEEVPARFLPVQEKAINGRAVTSTGKGEPGILFGNIQLLPEQEIAKLQARADARRANPRTRPPAIDLVEVRARRAAREEFAKQATELEIDGRPGRPVILETGPMAAPVRKFDECSRDSLRDWGVDPSLEEKIVRPVWLANAGNLISSEEYPKKMLFAGQQSEVKTRVLVDASGRVTKCTSLSHFNLPEFNQLVCDRITGRGRFEPAELADGTKVPSFYTVHIKFVIAP
jgi:hypothetical protein